MTITCNVENVPRYRVEGFLCAITKCLGGEYACDVTSCCSRVVGVAEHATSVVVALFSDVARDGGTHEERNNKP